MAGEKNNGPIGTKTNQPVVDAGTLVRWASPHYGPVGLHNDQQEFEAAFNLLKAEIANAGFIATLDGATRARYDQLLREFRDDIYAEVRQSKLTWGEAAEQARGMRDDVMRLTRSRTSPVGRSIAERLKPRSPDA